MKRSLKIAEEPARIPLHVCPACFKKIDAASAVNEPGVYATPNAGEYTVCFYCLAWLVFRDDLSMRVMLPREMKELEEEERDTLMQITQAIGAYHATQRTKVR